MCSRSAIDAYLRKLSQPILDRIDLQVELHAVPAKEMMSEAGARFEQVEPGIDPRAMVREAHERQLSRQAKLNAFLGTDELRSQGRVDARAIDLLEKGAERLGLSARGFVRALRVSATIADLAADKTISAQHVGEALQYRALATLERYTRGPLQSMAIGE